MTEPELEEVRYFRDEKAARGRPPLQPVLARDIQEGYRLVGPDAVLTPPVEYAQWMDNHIAGPDTHILVAFEGALDEAESDTAPADSRSGGILEFPFGAELTAVWYLESRVISEADLTAAIPTVWGTPAASPDDY